MEVGPDASPQFSVAQVVDLLEQVHDVTGQSVSSSCGLVIMRSCTGVARSAARRKRDARG